MAIDYSGLLTGVSQDPKAQAAEMLAQSAIAQDPNIMAGAKYALSQAPRREAAMRQAAGGLLGRDLRSPVEKAAQELQKLTTSPNFDINNPEDLAQIVRLRQAMGDLTGAAQTAARIQTITTAKAQEDRAERALEIREEQLAMQKAAAGKAEEREDALLAQQGVSRALFVKQARDNGNENLALLIEKGAITLEKAASLLFGTSNAVIKAPSADEEQAFDRILGSEKFQKKIEDLEEREFTNWFWFVKDISDETKQAIYFKAKELMARQRLSAEDALEKAVTSIKALDQIPEGSDTDNQGRRKVDRRGRPLPDKTPSPQDDDGYLDLGK